MNVGEEKKIFEQHIYVQEKQGETFVRVIRHSPLVLVIDINCVMTAAAAAAAVSEFA